MTRRVVARDAPDLSLFPRRRAAIAIADLVIALSPVSRLGAAESILEALAMRLAPTLRL